METTQGQMGETKRTESGNTRVARNIAHQSSAFQGVGSPAILTKVFLRNVFSLHISVLFFFPCSSSLACQSLVSHISLIDGVRSVDRIFTYTSHVFPLSILPF